MKYLPCLVVLTCFTFFTGCEENNESSLCGPDAWAGNYRGVANCEGTEQDVTISVNRVGDRSILFDINSGSTGAQPVYPGIVVSDCTLSTTFTNNGTGTDLNATLSGNELTLSEFASGALNRSCTYSVSRD